MPLATATPSATSEMVAYVRDRSFSGTAARRQLDCPSGPSRQSLRTPLLRSWARIPNARETPVPMAIPAPAANHGALWNSGLGGDAAAPDSAIRAIIPDIGRISMGEARDAQGYATVIPTAAHTAIHLATGAT